MENVFARDRFAAITIPSVFPDKPGIFVDQGFQCRGGVAIPKGDDMRWEMKSNDSQSVFSKHLYGHVSTVIYAEDVDEINHPCRRIARVG